MSLTDVRYGGLIVMANQGETAQRHVAQPKPELCGSARAVLQTFISPQLSLSASSANRRTSSAHRESIPDHKVYWRTIRYGTARRQRVHNEEIEQTSIKRKRNNSVLAVDMTALFSTGAFALRCPPREIHLHGE